MIGNAQQRATPSPPAILTPLLLALAAGLCVAAVAAIVAVAGSSFDDSDTVIEVSLGFTLFSATSVCGAMLLRRGWESIHPLGWVTILLSAVSFVAVLVSALADTGDEFLGCVGLATLAGAHASIVLRDTRDGDNMAVRALCWTSILLSVSFAAAGAAAISGVIGDVGEDFARAMAVGLILVLLTFALAPILRRVTSGSAGAA
jgi:hypothetical protein